MQYGYFDNQNREYVISRVDVPVSWTNYIGVSDMCGVFNHTAGGYLFYKSPEYHRITRFRPNGVPMDRPGHYVYVRDDETGEYWTLSWQPVGLPLEKAKYECRHGLSYIKYLCGYSGIEGEEKLFIPADAPVELWDVSLKNNSGRKRSLSLFSYCEFSYHMIDADNKSFQSSLYCAGSSFQDGIIEYNLFYEDGAYQFFTSSAEPEGFDCLRDVFIGAYRTESKPEAVERGSCSGSYELGGNHCGALHHKITLGPSETFRIIYMLGEGGYKNARAAREKYGEHGNVDAAFLALNGYWENKLGKLQVDTPSEAMNTMLNIWTLYQSEINIKFSRFASFIEVGGRVGLGFRDTAQDSMTAAHSSPGKCRRRIIELLRGVTKAGYGLHLFQPEWFEPGETPKNGHPPEINKSLIHGINGACSDDTAWLVSSIAEYIKETGEFGLLEETVTYADGGEDTVYEHILRMLDFSSFQVGENGICKGLRADWNDCLNLGGGESAMVSFLHYWALMNFIPLASRTGNIGDAEKYAAVADNIKKTCEEVLWDGGWYIRGITASGRKIGTHADKEGRVHMESNTWAVLSGAAPQERGIAAMDAVDKYLYTPWGLMLNAPPYTKPDPEIGFITRVYPGLKENGAVFSHPNPWAWCAEALLGRGDRAMKFYDALCPYNQNDKIEIRKAEPYSYCQFIAGDAHTAYGRAHHPFMTGSGGWSYYAATHYILGIRPDYDGLIVDPCIPSGWKGFSAVRRWRGAVYRIKVENPHGVQKGVREIWADGEKVPRIPLMPEGRTCEIKIVMG